MRNINPTTTTAWKKLDVHFKEMKNVQLKDLFNDEGRAVDFSIHWEDFLVDYSKNLITKDTRALLIDLAEEAGLKSAMKSYFGGDKINATEGRSVMHTALRDEGDTAFAKEEVDSVKKLIEDFTQKIISGRHKGVTGKAITDVVNIGIGGSDLGPQMVVEALKFYKNHLNVHFISNVDGDHVMETLKKLNPETTLFVIVSKTFTTQETLTNAQTVRKWFVEQLGENGVSSHFVAVSTNLEAIADFGIDHNNVFPMWDWVGGRFSLWSSVGLSIALAIGYKNFESLLHGAYKMDRHFRDTPFDQNIPVLTALLSVWYNNFYKCETEAIIPYTQYLHRLPAYLQQAIMESNGKSVDRNGKKITYETGNIIWGEPGTNSQHAFFQLIHQGSKLIPADFIGFKKSLYGNKNHHDKLMANFFAQTEALMNGKTLEQVELELSTKEMSRNQIEQLKPFKVFSGNKPTTSFLIEKLTPESLGALIAMYEHKIFVQGVIWNIYSYDQWGVELGKQLATKILNNIDSIDESVHDLSTISLVNSYKKS
ncbi:glucose-6-phosphate isomerase [Dokdonia sp. Hel_I_53]|uniref:glucose-6-phosphate isomerase n=1 Tax=Dokdonia sp. Hel_I_53 TaxID=1566287 RepID=UPI0011A91E2D|nr:glucose-6-phosphate isomerase [Dokdonia sp. Hel_I_53]